MPVKLSEEQNPYSGRSPFDVLGVSPSATAREVQEAQAEKLEDIDYAGHDDETRIAKRDEINRAYDILRNARSRAIVEMFVFDNSVGREEGKQAAEKHCKVTFEYSEILKGSNEILPSSPELTDIPQEPVEMTHCLRLKMGSEQMTVDPRTEAISSITFDR